MITVKYFANLKQIAGKDEERFDLGKETTLDQVWEAISQTLPQIATLIKEKKIMVAVNYDVVSLDAVVHDGDEIALLPPFSGGS
ncbi:MAG: molybdopterin converting factor subunit 1 [Nitrospina sp.]|nr:MAG: molybdopterin converting factor subunit 1 [Nitrospina sp.]TDJ58226.1 MAG: molybdopterin converting factor subunit 1 [Nitrospina sp.]